MEVAEKHVQLSQLVTRVFRFVGSFRLSLRVQSMHKMFKLLRPLVILVLELYICLLFNSFL